MTEPEKIPPRAICSFLIALTALAASACKSGDTSPPAAASASASTSAARAPTRPAPRPVTATNVKVTRCELGPNPGKPSIATKLNPVGATRHLHLAPDGALYYFADFHPPTRLEPVADGCGYKLAPPLVERKDFDFALLPDGSITEIARSDESPKAKCRIKAFSELRYGSSRLLGTRLVFRDPSSLKEMDLAKDDCAPKELTLPDLVADGSLSSAALGLTGEDLLVGVGRKDWKWNKEVFRYDPAGRLVKRYGAGEGKGVINGPMSGCGDGFCVVTGYSFEIFDREGQKVTTVDLDALKLHRMNVNGVVDVPGKGVYVLVGYYAQKDKDVAQAELLRLDGVY